VTEHSESDRYYLEQLAVTIERLGIEAERHSNLVSIASRLHALRSTVTDPRDIDQLDAELDTILRVINPAGGGVTGVHDPVDFDAHLRGLLVGAGEPR
jgi:hypothetical protein